MSQLGRGRDPVLGETSVFPLFQMTKTSLSCIPVPLGIRLLLNPRACVLGGRLGQEQKHVAGIREETPRSMCPAAGVQEETRQPPAHAAGGRCQHSCPAVGGPAGERPPWAEGSSLSVSSPGLCMHHFGIPASEESGCFHSSSPPCKASWENLRGKQTNDPLVLGGLAKVPSLPNTW